MMSHPHRLVMTAQPGAEPLALDEVKAHLRIEHDADDALLTGLIAAAREVCESFTGRALVTRGYSLYLDSWPAGGAVLPRPPLASVVRVNVYDADGAAEEFGGWVADAASSPGRVLMTSAAPVPGREVNGIEIQYRAGYGFAPRDVPAALRQGMKQVVAHLYERRGEGGASALAASGALALFQPYRVMQL